MKNSIVENDWNFWVYPTPAERTEPEAVLVTSQWAETEAKLAAGGRVLFLAVKGNLDPARSPPLKRVPVFWNIQMTVRPPQSRTARFDGMMGLLVDAKHPALAGFPTERFCDFQWTPVIDNVPSVNLTDAPRELQPIVAAVDDYNRSWRLGVVFECRVGSGRLLVSSIDLANASAPVGTRQLRRSLVDYAAGENFQPQARLTVEQVRRLWAGPASAPTKPAEARADDPDLDDGSRKNPPAAAKKI